MPKDTTTIYHDEPQSETRLDAIEAKLTVLDYREDNRDRALNKRVEAIDAHLKQIETRQDRFENYTNLQFVKIDKTFKEIGDALGVATASLKDVISQAKVTASIQSGYEEV